MPRDIDPWSGQCKIPIAEEGVHLHVNNSDGHDPIIMLHKSAAAVIHREVSFLLKHEVENLFSWRVHVLKGILKGTQLNVGG